MHGIDEKVINILVGKPERPLGSPSRRWEENVRVVVGEIGWVWTGFICLKTGTIGTSCEHGNEPSGSIKDGEILD
jgi:hypothetical protein